MDTYKNLPKYEGRIHRFWKSLCCRLLDCSNVLKCTSTPHSSVIHRYYYTSIMHANWYPDCRWFAVVFNKSFMCCRLLECYYVLNCKRTHHSWVIYSYCYTQTVHGNRYSGCGWFALIFHKSVIYMIFNIRFATLKEALLKLY